VPGAAKIKQAQRSAEHGLGTEFGRREQDTGVDAEGGKSVGMTGPYYGADLALSSFSSPEAEDWLPKS
jgi:hypothetical protein